MNILTSKGLTTAKLAGIVPPIDNGNSWFSTVDPLPILLSGCSTYMGVFCGEDLMSAFYQHQTSTQIYPHVEERPPSYLDDSYSSDLLRYGALTQGFKLFMHAFGLLPRTAADIRGEHSMVHSGWKGNSRLVGPDESWDQLDPVQTSWGNSYNPTRLFHQLTPCYEGLDPCHVKLGVGTYDFLYEIVPTVENTRPRLPLSIRMADILRLTEEGSWSGVKSLWHAGMGTWLYNYVTLTDIVVNDCLYGLDLEYKSSWHLSTNAVDVIVAPKWLWDYNCHITISPVPSLPASRSNPENYEVRPLGVTCLTETHYSTYCTAEGGWGKPYPNSNRSVVGTTYTRNNTNNSSILSSRLRTGDSTDVWLTLRHIGLVQPGNGFTTAVERAMPDIRASSFLSSSMALDEAVSSLDTNLIEAIVELKDIRSLIPDIKSGIDALKGLSRGVTLNSIGDVVRFASRENLRGRFGYSPNIDLVLNTLPKVSRTLSRLQSLDSKPVQGYGSYSYVFPEGTFGREVSFLHTRTKIVARSLPSGDVSNILALKSLGLLPSFSNAWDLIPLSFVVDWIVNISGRMTALESMACLMLLDLKCLVHSYTVTSPFSDDELANYDLERYDGSTIELRYYSREVSRLIPYPRNSIYDFSMPSRSPEWTTPVSLVTSR